MRFYSGNVVGFNSAVSTTSDGIMYSVIDVNDKKGRKGIVKFGYDREYEVGLGSLILIEKKVGNIYKRSLHRIHFNYVNGRYVFDLIEFLEDKNIRYKLYKRYNLSEGCCGGYNTIISAYGEIVYGSNWCIDYREYYANINFWKRNHTMSINGKKVDSFLIDRDTAWQVTKEEALAWYQSLIEEARNYGYEELGQKLDELGINKNNHFLEIRFTDGTCVTGGVIYKKC